MSFLEFQDADNSGISFVTHVENIASLVEGYKDDSSDESAFLVLKVGYRAGKEIKLREGYDVAFSMIEQAQGGAVVCESDILASMSDFARKDYYRKRGLREEAPAEPS